MTAAMKLKDACYLEEKVMTNIDSILKNRDITLPTKVCLVKAMVFLVVMCACESWTIRCTGKTQRDQIGKEAGRGIRRGNTYSMADSWHCMAKTTTIL